MKPRSDTSTRPPVSIGTFTRRPSAVTTTATGRRSRPLFRPTLAVSEALRTRDRGPCVSGSLASLVERATTPTSPHRTGGTPRRAWSASVSRRRQVRVAARPTMTTGGLRRSPLQCRGHPARFALGALPRAFHRPAAIRCAGIRVVAAVAHAGRATRPVDDHAAVPGGTLGLQRAPWRARVDPGRSIVHGTRSEPVRWTDDTVANVGCARRMGRQAVQTTAASGIRRPMDAGRSTPSTPESAQNERTVDARRSVQQHRCGVSAAIVTSGDPPEGRRPSWPGW